MRDHHPVDQASVGTRAGATGRTTKTAEEQERAAALLAERTEQHQAVVRALAASITTNGTFFEDPGSFDLLFVPTDAGKPIVLFEVKTVDDDAAQQCRLAVGQLSYYHFFEVSPQWEDRAVIEVAVFDKAIPDELSNYLAGEGITSTVMTTDGQWAMLNQVEPDLPQQLTLQPPASGQA
jgi:hypothetical protein